MVVHFPIALLIIAFAGYVAEIITGKAEFRKFAFWLHLAGVAGAVAAILTGDYADGQIAQNEIIAEISKEHETFGMITGWGFGVLAVWTYLRLKSEVLLEKIGFAVVYLLMIGVLVLAAMHGGELVYDHGAGVAPMEEIIRGN